MPRTAYIYDAVRTPRGRGKKTGSLHEVKPAKLAAGLLAQLRDRHKLNTALVDDVIMGCVNPVGEQGGCIAKTAVHLAQWAECVPAFQLDRFCASGLEAVNLAAMKIASEWEDVVVAGGIESMSRVPLGAAGGAWTDDPEISLQMETIPQGVSADLMATLDGYDREDVDAFALESQRRAAHAWQHGHFQRSVVPVRDDSNIIILDHDEYIRPDTTMEMLSALKPAFATMGTMGYDDMALRKYANLERINHIHTAGNSSGIVDGASAVLLGSGDMEKKLGLAPRGRVVATAVTACDPVIMLAGPAPAAKKCLAKAGLKASDIDLFEINEAFSAVALRFMAELGIPHDITNVNGGSIALGHPLGATGGMLVGTMLDELERQDLKRGLIALCVAGGMGIATIIERV